MLTHKERILAYLDRYYKVYTSTFSMDVYYENNHYLNKFEMYDFLLVFGDYKTDENGWSGDIFNKWKEEKVSVIDEKVNAYLFNMHEFYGFQYLTDKLLEKFADEETITPMFLANRINLYCGERYVKPNIEKYFDWLDLNEDFETLLIQTLDVFIEYKHYNILITETLIELYKFKYLLPRVDEYFATLDLTKPLEELAIELGNGLSRFLSYKDLIKSRFNIFYHENHVIPIVNFHLNSVDLRLSSSEIIEQVCEKHSFTHLATKERLEEHINEWYCKNKTLPFMNDFLSQLVIISRPYDWLVKWVGHGQVTSSTVAELMKKENSYQRDFAEGMYDDWFGDKVITAAEKMTAKNEIFDLTARGADAKEIEDFIQSIDDELA